VNVSGDVAPNPCSNDPECTDVSPCATCTRTLKSTVGKCRGCGDDVGGLYSCPCCRSRIHVFYGRGIGKETSSQLIICSVCDGPNKRGIVAGDFPNEKNKAEDQAPSAPSKCPRKRKPPNRFSD
jgi:hypothetical protein